MKRKRKERRKRGRGGGGRKEERRGKRDGKRKKENRGRERSFMFCWSKEEVPRQNWGIPPGAIESQGKAI